MLSPFQSVSTMNVPPTAPEPIARTQTVALWAIVATQTAILCMPARWWVGAGLFLVGGVVLFGLLFSVFGGRGEVVLVGWILIFPLGYYYLSFPQEHSLITLDRVFVGILLAAACFADHRSIHHIPRALRRSALCWALFLVFAALAIPRAKTPMGSLRLWLEAFVFPALVAWYILRHVDVRRCLPAMHAATCVMTIYVAALGIGEVVLQRDLLPLPESTVIVAGDYAGDYQNPATEILVRPNGPFSTVNSFAMIGMVSLFFLLFLKNASVGPMPAGQRLLHSLGIAASLAETLMPLFKSVFLSLIVVLLVDAYYHHGKRRLLRVTALVGFGVAFLLIRIALPVVFEERADPLTFYARIAQESQTWALFLDHPINGAGLGNFHDAVQNSKYATYYREGEALDYPHNNLGAALAETGLTGFLPFVASQLLLAYAFWKLCEISTNDLKVVWKVFVFLFLGYWINGLALTTAHYGDLNLWYMFVLAVLYKFGMTSPNFSG
jgi:O-antigen ligase